MAVIPGSVRFTGFIAPSDDTDTYATQDETYNRGGYRTVADITARDNITTDRRLEGMLVFVLSEQKYYTLSGGITNSHWVEAEIGGGSGSFTIDINQTLHGFSLNDWLIFDAGSGKWELAFKPGNLTEGAVGYVSEVYDVNSFELSTIGPIATTYTDLASGEYYFVRTDGSGTLTATPTGDVTVPRLFAISNNQGIVLPYRPSEDITATSSGSGDFTVGKDLYVYGDTFIKGEVQGFSPLKMGDDLNMQSNDIINCATISASSFVGDGSGLTGIAAFTAPDNIVYVDPDQDEIPGSRYQTYAAALAYCQSQSPTIDNKWAIKITGEISDNIPIYGYIAVIGELGQTRLTGQVTPMTAFGGSDFFVNQIAFCRVDNLACTGAANTLVLYDCNIHGGTSTAAPFIFGTDCYFLGGDFSSFSGTMRFYASVFFGGTYSPSLEAINCDITGNPPGVTLNGGTFWNCLFGAGSLTIAAGTYNIFKGYWQSDVDITAGYALNFIGTALNGSVDLDVNGGSLAVYGCPYSFADIDYFSGTYTNYGAHYDNRTSGLAAEDTKSAIDELAASLSGNWVKYTVNATDITDVSTTGTYSLFTTAQREVIEMFAINRTSNWTATGLTKAEMSAGIGGQQQKYIPKQNLTVAYSDEYSRVFRVDALPYVNGSAENIKLYFYSDGPTWNNINTGSIEIWVKKQVLPA